MSVYDHPSTLELAAARDDPAAAEAIQPHLATCVACRVRAARLWHTEMPGEPDEDVVTRILEASSPGPAILASFTGGRDLGLPRPGEIWRIGRDEAMLAWVRRVFEDAVDVIPAVLDIELADQESVFVPAESTPLGMPLALLTGVRTHVGMPALLQRIGYVNAFTQVNEVMAATREGRPPQGIQAGPPIDTKDDQRIEYRQLIADLLSDMAPDRWPDDPMPDAGQSDSNSFREAARIIDILTVELPVRHSGAQVSPMAPVESWLGPGITLYGCTRVTYLDTSLIVAVLDGQDIGDAIQSTTVLADACLALARIEPDVTAIAITTGGAERPAIVLKVADLRTAFEAPSGRKVPPRLAREPLPLIDALAKFLDRQVTAWEVTEPVAGQILAIELRDVASQSASEAVTNIIAAGKRALTEAKKRAWTHLPDDLAAQITESISAIMANEPIDDVLDSLIERGTQ
jgi:hypothetical protein